jgi:hypothetical protein
MGKSSTATSRAKSAEDTNSGTSGEQGGQGIVGRTMPEWHEWIVQKNPQGRMGDFMAAVTGKALDKRQRAHLATIYKNYPGGAPAMMAAICFVAVKEPKGDPVLYLKQLSDKKRYGKGSVEPKEKGFSRDEYVES